MDMPSGQPRPKASWFTRLLIHIAGADVETLNLCPQRDLDNVRAVAAIMIGTWLYQTGLLAIIAHRLFAAPGEIRPELVLAAMFLATFVLLIDSYMVMRSGWHLSGIQELKRGGIDISGGIGPRIKAALFLVFRIFLSIGIAQLTAIFLSLLIFGADIYTRAQDSYQHANAALITKATAFIDGDIQRATVAVNSESAREAALAAQVAVLRQDQIDPSAGDPQMQLAQQEVTQLLTQKADADQSVQKAEAFASDELGGIRGPGNSGIPGNGPRRKAAMESVANAKDEQQQIAVALQAARNRLDSLRTQWMASSQTTVQQSHSQFPAFENALADEQAKLSSLKDSLAHLTTVRDASIRAIVEASPDQVPIDDGLLAQITVLDHIAHENPKIAAVIILVDLTSFGFELAAVLAKVTSYVPTTYAALLARDSYMDAVRIVDGMMVELNRGADSVAPEVNPVASATQRVPSGREEGAPPAYDPFANSRDPMSVPPKRPRGRPPKTPTGEHEGSPLPFADELGSHEPQ